jgi:hypothetical protein
MHNDSDFVTCDLWFVTCDLISADPEDAWLERLRTGSPPDW